MYLFGDKEMGLMVLSVSSVAVQPLPCSNETGGPVCPAVEALQRKYNTWHIENNNISEYAEKVAVGLGLVRDEGLPY
jgi:hypothetical protein